MLLRKKFELETLVEYRPPSSEIRLWFFRGYSSTLHQMPSFLHFTNKETRNEADLL